MIPLSSPSCESIEKKSRILTTPKSCRPKAHYLPDPLCNTGCVIIVSYMQRSARIWLKKGPPCSHIPEIHTYGFFWQENFILPLVSISFEMQDMFALSHLRFALMVMHRGLCFSVLNPYMQKNFTQIIFLNFPCTFENI